MKTQAPEHPDLTVVPLLGAPEKHRMLDHFHYLSNEVRFGVYQNNLATLERALLERVFYVKKDGVFREPFSTSEQHLRGMSEFHSKLIKLSHHSTPLKLQEYAELFQDRRRKIYQRAADENLAYGFHDKLSSVRPFVKREKYNFSAKPDAVPRVIQPRNPRYVVETGRYIKPIEKKIYKNINTVFGHEAVFKGLNAQRRGELMREHWDSFIEPVAISIDAERFDEHVSAPMLEWEHSIYQSFYHGDRFFKRLMRLQRFNRGIGFCKDGIIKYRINRNRMSGDSNTSLGNVTIMCGLIYTYCNEKNIKFRLADDGDDSVTIIEKQDLDAFQLGLYDWFKGYGFSMAVEEPVYIFEKIVFCQSQPVYDGTSWIMVRDPRVALSKNCLSLKPIRHQKVRERWMSAVGKGGMSLSGGIPIWQNFYQQFIVKSNGAKPLTDPTLETGAARMARGMKREFVSNVPPECRFSFWLAFDISPECQIAIEETFDEYRLSDDTDQPVYRTLPLNL